MSIPLVSLIIFFGITITSYLLFRPNSGFYWIFIKGEKTTEKVMKEDILKILYHAEYKNETLFLSEIERLLNTNNSKKIVKTIVALINSNLISRQQEIISLTKEGRNYGYNKLNWHDRSEVMEHKLSYKNVDNLSSQLELSYFDSQEKPIPTKSDGIVSERGIPMYNLPENFFGKIIHIKDKPEIVYKQILEKDLHIGSKVRIIGSDKFRVKFYCEGKKFVLANEVAANLIVIQLSKEEKNELDFIRMSLLQDSETGIVEGISKECRGESRRRLLDLGFVSGTKISVGLVSPMRDPRVYQLMSTNIALRNEQANFILIKKQKPDKFYV